MNSGTIQNISLHDMRSKLVDFLSHYGGQYISGKSFSDVVGTGNVKNKLLRLLKAVGFENDPQGFLTDLAEKLSRCNTNTTKPIQYNNIVLPQNLLLSILEIVRPGNRIVSINSVSDYKDITNITLSEDESSEIERVIKTYPVRLSMHTIRQMMLSRNIAYQYSPFPGELDPIGQVNTWLGQHHEGLLERMYQNRVIFLLNMTCPVYCRFCFRKHKDLRNLPNPNIESIRRAVDYVNQHKSIKEVLISGGDPFLHKKNLVAAINDLSSIPHVQNLRIATRSISYYPQLFSKRNAFWLQYLKTKHLELQQLNKRLEIATHFIHPDEISIDSLHIITSLSRAGIPVYIQTPFLNDCNDKGPELARLFYLLRGAGAELHYIFIPCSPIHGNSKYWSTISRGHKAAIYLRAHVSDRAIPKLCTATAIGKIDWNSSGWAVENDKEDDRFFWIRTPYTQDFFKNFAENVHTQEMVRVNEEGTLDARFMAKIGDDSLLMGNAKPALEKEKSLDSEGLKALQILALEDQRIGSSVVSTVSPTLNRPHETRVELDADSEHDALEVIRRDSRITDVLITSQYDAMEKLYEISEIVSQLRDVPHVNTLRIRSLGLNYKPELYTRGAIEKLGDLNHLTISDPLRLEIETQFLHRNEIRDHHASTIRALRNLGVTVYNNTPLLSGINCSAEEMHHLAFAMRELGIEFHHVYVAGWPLQQEWSAKHPVQIDDVIDIASRVRRDGSGREIPRYMVSTELGEVDFGLTCRFLMKHDEVWIKVLPYCLDYFKALDPDYQWPQETKFDENGFPIVHVPGLKTTEDHFLNKSL